MLSRSSLARLFCLVSATDHLDLLEDLAAAGVAGASSATVCGVPTGARGSGLRGS